MILDITMRHPDGSDVSAAQIWEMGADKRSAEEFAEALDSSELEAFGFTDGFVIELWGAITGAQPLNGSGY